MQFYKNDVLLFQGDSVTEGGRNLNEPYDLGSGYVSLIRDKLLERYPEHNLTILNRGISAHRAAELAERWDADCVSLKPSAVTILVGINDTWHRYSYRFEHVTAEMFYNQYKEILVKTKNITGRVVLMEPFLLPANDEMLNWREDLDSKTHVIRKLALEFSALYVPLDGLFAAAYIKRGIGYYAPDGVHPSHDGCRLIADAWLDCVL
jgi:lysophospholipase L1-like esterase